MAESGLKGNKKEDISKRSFVTKSSYEGSWNAALNTMEGFGTYHYPEGTEYRGYFLNGKFHGYGYIKLSAPYKFTLKGEFYNGKLMKIDEMSFEDGLVVKGILKDNKFNSDEWDYLQDSDRRYHTERTFGLQPTGPTSYLTHKLVPRPLKPNTFDTEAAIFDVETGFAIHRMPPFSSKYYVSSPKEVQWIKSHCRHGPSSVLEEPQARFCREIIKCNLQEEKAMTRQLAVYAPNNELDYSHLQHKLVKHDVLNKPLKMCKGKHPSKFASSYIANAALNNDSSSDVFCVGIAGSSSTDTDSFDDIPLADNVEQLKNIAERMRQLPEETISVVPSNLTRPASFVDYKHSDWKL